MSNTDEMLARIRKESRERRHKNWEDNRHRDRNKRYWDMEFRDDAYGGKWEPTRTGIWVKWFVVTFLVFGGISLIAWVLDRIQELLP